MYEQQPPYQGGYQQQQPYGQPGNDPDYQKMLASVRPRSKAPWVLLLLVLAGAGVGGLWLMHERDTARGEAAAANTAADGAKKALEDRLKALEAEKAELATAR